MLAQSTLQWGHGLLAVEIDDCRSFEGLALIASMGPRLVSRGNRASLAKPRLVKDSFNGATAC